MHGTEPDRALGVGQRSMAPDVGIAGTATSVGSAIDMPAPSAIRPSRKMRVASPGSPSATSRPWLSTTPRSQMLRTVSAECVTRRMVRPSFWNWLTRSMHLRWKRSSPTASTSSTTRTSGSTFTATAKPSRTYMPDE